PRAMQTESLQRAIGAIHVRFGGHSLVRAAHLPPARPWPTGQPAVDGLSGIGGLPMGRVSVLQGAQGSGKLSLALALLALATREFARASSLTLQLEWRGWLRERGVLVGQRSRVSCVKNKLAAPGAEAGLEIRYPLAPGHLPGGPLLAAEPAAERDAEAAEERW